MLLERKKTDTAATFARIAELHGHTRTITNFRNASHYAQNFLFADNFPTEFNGLNSMKGVLAISLDYSTQLITVCWNLWSEFLATDTEVPGSIPGANRFF